MNDQRPRAYKPVPSWQIKPGDVNGLAQLRMRASLEDLEGNRRLLNDLIPGSGDTLYRRAISEVEDRLVELQAGVCHGS